MENFALKAIHAFMAVKLAWGMDEELFGMCLKKNLLMQGVSGEMNG